MSSRLPESSHFCSMMIEYSQQTLQYIAIHHNILQYAIYRYIFKLYCIAVMNIAMYQYIVILFHHYIVCMWSCVCVRLFICVCMHVGSYVIVLGAISFILLVYSITNSEWYSVSHAI